MTPLFDGLGKVDRVSGLRIRKNNDQYITFYSIKSDIWTWVRITAPVQLDADQEYISDSAIRPSYGNSLFDLENSGQRDIPQASRLARENEELTRKTDHRNFDQLACDTTPERIL